MSYVPENKVAAYFPVAKNHVLSEIMLELLVHTYCENTFFHFNTSVETGFSFTKG